MVHFGEFLKTSSLRSNSVTRQVSFIEQKLVPKFKNSNETFWVIFKQCDSVEYVTIQSLTGIFVTNWVKHCNGNPVRNWSWVKHQLSFLANFFLLLHVSWSFGFLSFPLFIAWKTCKSIEASFYFLWHSFNTMWKSFATVTILCSNR